MHASELLFVVVVANLNLPLNYNYVHTCTRALSPPMHTTETEIVLYMMCTKVEETEASPPVAGSTIMMGKVRANKKEQADMVSAQTEVCERG